MNDRKRLPDRRFAETTKFEVDGHSYYLTVGHFEDMKVAEIFINSSMKLGSMADINACDGAVAVSLALQYGCPIDVLSSGMKRNADGSAQGPLGAALDTIMKGKA